MFVFQIFMLWRDFCSREGVYSCVIFAFQNFSVFWLPISNNMNGLFFCLATSHHKHWHLERYVVLNKVEISVYILVANPWHHIKAPWCNPEQVCTPEFENQGDKTLLDWGPLNNQTIHLYPQTLHKSQALRHFLLHAGQKWRKNSKSQFIYSNISLLNILALLCILSIKNYYQKYLISQYTYIGGGGNKKNKYLSMRSYQYSCIYSSNIQLIF